MSDAMTFAEIDDQTVELLPARTVLSAMRTDTVTNPTPIGQVSHPAGQGQGIGHTWMELLGLRPSPVDPSNS